jgi:hypothetical protein
VISFVALGSIGTYGHLAMGHEIARVMNVLAPGVEVRLVIEDQHVPSYLASSFIEVVRIRVREQACSRGGRLNADYSGEDVARLVDADKSGVWIFSTFFDASFVKRLKRRGATCVWMGNMMRLSFWELFHLDGNASLFDEIVVLDDLDPITASLASPHPMRRSPLVLPPPYYVEERRAARPPRRGISEGHNHWIVGVSCGGGLVNGSDSLLISSVEGLQERLGSQVDLHVYPGEVAPSRLPLSDPRLTLRVGSLMDHLDEFDLLVCQSGYHTVQEILFRSLPAVLVPAHRLIDDQELRAVSAAARCGTPVVLPSGLDELPAVVRDVLGHRGRRLEEIEQRMIGLIEEQGWAASAVPAWGSFLATLGINGGLT